MAFDVPTAKLSWNLARIAYKEDHTAAERQVRDLGLDGYVPFDAGGSTQAFGCFDDGRRFVAFRGTQPDPVDWITDARFNPVRGALGGSVHSGFKVALDEVWGDVSGFLADSERPAWITGHSLGAALAMLAAARHVEAGNAVGGVYTFGQPRTGLGDFTSAYDARLGEVTFRFVNHIDLVTRVPLLVQRYRHAGRRMYWDADGAMHADASWWHVAKDDLAYRLTHFGRIRSIGLEPHFIPAYTQRVDAL
jgi:triacylglycerol lipase